MTKLEFLIEYLKSIDCSVEDIHEIILSNYNNQYTDTYRVGENIYTIHTGNERDYIIDDLARNRFDEALEELGNLVWKLPEYYMFLVDSIHYDYVEAKFIDSISEEDIELFTNSELVHQGEYYIYQSYEE